MEHAHKPVLNPDFYINELHLQKKTVRESSNSLFIPIVSSFVFLLPMRITFPKSQHLIQKKGLTCSATKPEIYCSGFVGVPSHHFDIIAKKLFENLLLSYIFYHGLFIYFSTASSSICSTLSVGYSPSKS